MRHIKILLIFFLCFPLGTNAEQMRGLRSMQLSECGQAIAGFKQFLREARHCQSSNDCVAVEGKCPLGCKFYVHKIFQTIIEKRREEVGGVCGNTQCSVECPEEEDIKLICKNKRCEKVK